MRTSSGFAFVVVEARTEAYLLMLDTQVSFRTSTCFDTSIVTHGSETKMMNRHEIQGGWDIQKMTPADLDEVISIATSDSLAPWSKKMFLEEMQHAFAHCFVMKRKDRSKHPVVGFICFRNVTEESELLKICVHPDYRQLGIGKKLMQFYIDFCRRSGVRTFHLEVNPSNQPAIHLYQSFSYEPSGMRKKFYQRKLDALLMMRQV